MKRILQTTVLVLGTFALLVPSALADRPDDRPGLLGIGLASRAPDSIRPDDRAETRGPGALAATAAQIRPDDRPGLRGPGSAPTVVAAPVAADGFDWADAGLGAVGAFGLALLLLGGLQVAWRARRGHVTV